MQQNTDIPQILVFANDLQRAGDYGSSRKYYEKFLVENPAHCLRFKALFEIADNFYYEKNYREARKAYEDFQTYCRTQQDLTEYEAGWVQAYTKLAESRLKKIDASI